MAADAIVLTTYQTLMEMTNRPPITDTSPPPSTERCSSSQSEKYLQRLKNNRKSTHASKVENEIDRRQISKRIREIEMQIEREEILIVQLLQHREKVDRVSGVDHMKLYNEGVDRINHSAQNNTLQHDIEPHLNEIEKHESGTVPQLQCLPSEDPQAY